MKILEWRSFSRFWFYFRTGYAVYVVFFLTLMNTLTILYYLLAKNIAWLEVLFPSFLMFSILAVGIGLPLTIMIGWLHLKQSLAFSSEIDIGVEANPYYYKLAPGHQKEVSTPLNLLFLRQIRKLSEKHNLLSADDAEEMNELEKKLELLMAGGHVGSPKRKINW